MRLATIAAALLPATAFAAGPQLRIQQVELSQKRWPHARAYVNVFNAQGAAVNVPGLSPELFRVYENGDKDSSKIEKVDTLENAGTGAAVVVVIQASGSLLGIEGELKKSVQGFINSLGEKDQVAVVDYSESAETVAPFSEEKGEVAARAAKITFTGKSYLLYDGLEQAISLYSVAALGKGAATLPAAKAIVVISDGRDNGSATDVEKVVADAQKRHVPIHAVGHSELDQDALPDLQRLAERTGGTWKAAPAVEDVNKALGVIRDNIAKTLVVQWKTELDHDGKDHKIDVAMESDTTAPLRSSTVVRTPSFFDWVKLAIVAGVILLLAIAAVVIYAVSRPKAPPTRFCPACKRAQMPEWEVCLFCLKSAKARLTVQKGAAKGKTYPLVGKIVSVGSGPENNIRLLDGAVSSKHCGVAIDENKFEIVDLNSKNGVLVNGKKTPRRFLRNGDVITVGVTELKFESAVASGEDEAED